MHRFLVAAATAGMSLACLPATAQTLSYGATLTSNYISRGASQTNNRAALQPWVEYETAGGWYGGLWASNVSLGADSVEVDLYGGYRWAIGTTSFDMGYARYFYNSSGDAGGEVYLLLEHEMDGASIFGGTYFGHAGGLTLNDAHVGMSVAVAPNVTASGRLGVTPGGNSYADIGVGYDMNDSVSFDLRYHRAVGPNDRFVFSTSVGF